MAVKVPEDGEPMSGDGAAAAAGRAAEKAAEANGNGSAHASAAAPAAANGHTASPADDQDGGDEPRVKTPKRKRCLTPVGACCTGFSVFLGLFFILGGILVFLLFRDLVDSIVRSKVRLAEDSPITKSWMKPPVTPILRLYFFNYTNPEEFLAGGKPRVEEKGPYVYRQKWEKVNVTWSDSGKVVSYRLKKVYRFAPDLSVGSEDDELTLPNVPMMTAVGGEMHFADEKMRNALAAMLKVLDQKPFAKVSVGDITWGMKHPLVELGNDLKPAHKRLPTEEYGFFVGKNDTTRGLLLAMTGILDADMVGQILSFNGQSELDFWRKEGQCNSIRGTDGSVFHPGLSKTETLHIFNRDLCQSLPLVFQKEVDMKGIPGYRFVPPGDVFATPEEKPENLCFCPPGSAPGEPGCQTPSGLFNMSACQYDSPIMLSWPHFFQADPTLLETVEGLEPVAEKHQFFIDIQPKLGTALRASARTQINVFVDPAPNISAAEGLRRIILPVVWFSDGVDGIDDPHSLALLRTAIFTPETARAITYPTMLVVGSLILLMVVAYVARSVLKRMSAGRKGDPEVPMERLENEDDEVANKEKAGNNGVEVRPVGDHKQYSPVPTQS